MPTLATLLTPLVLAGLTWADCSAVDPSTTGAPPSATGELDRNAGYEFFRTGQYQQALACYNEALKAAEADPSSDTRAIASELSDLAIISEEMGRYDTAQQYYQRELDLLQPLGDAAGTAIGETYAQLGGLLLVEGSLNAAESNYKKAVVLLASHAGSDDVRTAKALGGMGRVYAEWGRYEESDKLLRQARAIAEKGAPKTDAALIAILDSEAALLCQAHKFAEAEKCWLRALKIAGEDYGNSGLGYSALLLHLGQLYTAIRDYPAAESVLKRGLAV